VALDPFLASLIGQGLAYLLQSGRAEAERQRRQQLYNDLMRVLGPYLSPDFLAFTRSQLVDIAAPGLAAIRADTNRAARQLAEAFAGRGLSGSSLEASASANVYGRGAQAASQLWQQLTAANQQLSYEMQRWAAGLVSQAAQRAEEAERLAQDYLSRIGTELGKIVAAYLAPSLASR